jgi:hypothetical protein
VATFLEGSATGELDTQIFVATGGEGNIGNGFGEESFHHPHWHGRLRQEKQLHNWQLTGTKLGTKLGTQDVHQFPFVEKLEAFRPFPV